VATLVTLQRASRRADGARGGEGGCAGGDGGGILVLMGHVSRHPDEHLFFRAVQQHFAVRVIHGPHLECLGRPGGVSPDARARDSRQEEADGRGGAGVDETALRRLGGSQGQLATDGLERAQSVAETAVRVLEMVPLGCAG